MRRRYFQREPVHFDTERVLCDTLRASARAAGFKVYPETGDYDLLLVDPSGEQVGVQAKLRPNIGVLSQAIRRKASPGVDVRAVAVPTASGEFLHVAAALRVLVIEVAWLEGSSSRHIEDHEGRLERVGADGILAKWVERAPRWPNGGKRLWVPPIESDLPAGVSGPVTLTPWKIATVRVARLVRERGTEGVTAAEIGELGGSLSTWRAWLQPMEGTKPRRYRPRYRAELPDARFPPGLVAEILAIKE